MEKETFKFKTVETQSHIKSLNLDVTDHTYDVMGKENFDGEYTPSQYEQLRRQMKLTCIMFGGGNIYKMQIEKIHRSVFVEIKNFRNRTQWMSCCIGPRGKVTVFGTAYGV